MAICYACPVLPLICFQCVPKVATCASFILRWKRSRSEKQVVFFAIGFETTAPPNAMVVLQAKQLGIQNFSVLVSHVCVPPAMKAILSSKTNRVQAFLAAGHVCAVMGYHEYPPIAQKYHVPIVVTGFEPVDLLVGVLAA